MYTENALLFPNNAIPMLRNLRGDNWRTLVDHVSTLPECHEETLAFMMMMINLNGCLSCETDSFRAMRGCCACAQQTIRRFKGSDDELLTMFEDALKTVRTFASRGTPIARLIQVPADPIPLASL